MNITEVRVKLVNVKNEKLKGFASITIDNDFVVRDLKIIEGGKGLFVAMPSRKLSDRCPKCGCKNHLKAKYCNECGTDLTQTSFGKGRIEEMEGLSENERQNLHADIAHPINSACREQIQKLILKAYKRELEAKLKYTGVYKAEDLEKEPDPDFSFVSNKQEKAESSSSQPEKSESKAPEQSEDQSDKKKFGLGIFS